MDPLAVSRRRSTRLRTVIIITVVLHVTLISITTLAEPVHQPFYSKGPNAQLFDDRIIVKYKKSVLPSNVPAQPNVPAQRKAKMEDIARELSVQYGVTAIRILPTLGVHLFRIREGDQLHIVIEALRKNPNIEFAEYNFRIIGEVTPPPRDPNDPQWLMGGRMFWGLKKIGMRSAWGYQTDANNIIVAVIDSGIDYNHPDLALNIYTDLTGGHGYDFCDNNDVPLDPIHHGTTVAGVIGARGNNNIGGVGTAWRVQLVALRALCEVKDGIATGGVFNAIAAMQWAMEIHAHIINNSWRVDPTLPDFKDQINILQGTVETTNCQGDGVVLNCVPAAFIAAAGNGRFGEPLNNDPCTGTNAPCGSQAYPANFAFSNVISVAATDCTNPTSCTNNVLWTNSHYGSDTVHIAAPGNQIDTTDLWNAMTPETGYTSGQGTSMATAFVSGCAALLQARKKFVANTFLSVGDLQDLLFNNADTPFTGQIIGGRSLNCAKAMAAI